MTNSRVPALVRKTGMTDAISSFTLTITKTDINKAEPMNPYSCAAACALKRQGFAEAIVMRATTYINHGTKRNPNWVRYATPAALTREIIALDRGGSMEPGDFNMQAFSPARRLGVHRWRSSGKRKDNTKPRYHHITPNIREKA